MDNIDIDQTMAGGSSRDEDVMLHDVVQDDHELFYLHHYLTELFDAGDIAE